MGITPNPEARASNIFEAAGNATSKAGPTIVSILTMASLLGALTWILNQSLVQSDATCSHAIDMLDKAIDVKDERINTILQSYIENAPRRIDAEGRAWFEQQLQQIAEGVRENRDNLLRLRAIMQHQTDMPHQSEPKKGQTGR